MLKVDIKNKKTKKAHLLILFFILAVGVSFFANKATAATNVNVSPCSCKENNDIGGIRSEFVYVSTSDECNQACANRKDKYNKYFAFTIEGTYQLVTKTPGGSANIASHTCSCSNTAPYSNAITGTFAATNEAGCIAQCQSSNSKVYQLDNNQWKDVPALPVSEKSSKKFEYTLLESLPGFFNANSTLTDFPALILAIYKFGIWTVGIAGLFMLVVGGFMYMASAGNTSTAGNARGIIWDALLGIVAALGAYLILYVINPDLTKLNLNFSPVSIDGPQEMPAGGAVLMEGRLTDVVARQNLSAAGISVNKENCSSSQATNCTSLEGIPGIAIGNLISLKNACKQFNSSCSFVVTGGTEAGHKSHGPGNPMIDIREDSVVAGFLSDVKTKKQYSNYGIGQVCTVSPQNLESISYNHAYNKTCQDPSSVAHFHLSFN